MKKRVLNEDGVYIDLEEHKSRELPAGKISLPNGSEITIPTGPVEDPIRSNDLIPSGSGELPTAKNNKRTIMDFLDKKGIEYDPQKTKKELMSLFPVDETPVVDPSDDVDL